MGGNDASSLRRLNRRRAGFSLIELLVVVSLIAMVVGLLLPVLSRVRGASRLAGCFSNLRQLGIAMEAYLADHDGGMPVGAPIYPDWYRGYTFGGRMVDPESRLRSGSHEAPPPYARPLNAYVSERDRLGRADSTEEELDRIDMPVYHCPADTQFNYQEKFWADEAYFTMSNYDAAGTSYSFNVIWQDVERFEDKPAKGFRHLRQARMEMPTLFSPILDDSSEWALWRRRLNSIPHHGRKGTHNLLFFDGHTDAVEIDPHDRFTSTYRVVFEEDDS